MSKIRGYKFHIIAKTRYYSSVTKIFLPQEIQPANLGVYQFEWEVNRPSLKVSIFDLESEQPNSTIIELIRKVD